MKHDETRERLRLIAAKLAQYQVCVDPRKAICDRPTLDEAIAELLRAAND